jgi:hypothetical protein
MEWISQEIIKREFKQIPLTEIDSTNWLGDREEWELDGSDKAIYEIVKSIEECGAGLIHPISVRFENNRYRITAGKRRFAAITILNKKYKDIDPTRYATIDALVISGGEDVAKLDMKIAFHENKIRKSTTSMGMQKALLLSIAKISSISINIQDDDELTKIGLHILGLALNPKRERQSKYKISSEEAQEIVQTMSDITRIPFSAIRKSVYRRLFELDNRLLQYYDENKIFYKTIFYISQKSKFLDNASISTLTEKIVADVSEQKTPKEINSMVIKSVEEALLSDSNTINKKLAKRYRIATKKAMLIPPTSPLYIEVLEKLALLESTVNKYKKGKK